MDNLFADDDDEYNSDEDEEYVVPEDAPPENENDAYLIDKGKSDEDETTKPTKSIDDLWSDFIKPSSSSEQKSKEAEKEPVVKEAVHPAKRKSDASSKKPSGLDLALGDIKRAKKASVLDKSKQDWDKHVKEQSIEEELELHKRSKESYLDKQDFIAKADYSKFVAEREMRQKAGKPP